MSQDVCRRARWYATDQKGAGESESLWCSLGQLLKWGQQSVLDLYFRVAVDQQVLAVRAQEVSEDELPDTLKGPKDHMADARQVQRLCANRRGSL